MQSYWKPKKLKAPKLPPKDAAGPPAEWKLAQTEMMLGNAIAWIQDRHPTLSDDNIKEILKGNDFEESHIITLN